MKHRFNQKYESDDRELLLGVYKRLLFKPAFALLPKWVPPNAISIFGVACAVGAVLSAWLATHGHPRFYLLIVVQFYAYIIADNIDGPQARRTNRCGASGELLDHGLDGISSGCMLVAAGLILHMSPLWFFALAALGALGFVTVMWEQYRTGTLIIPKISGTEGVTIVSGLALIAFFGHEPAWLHFETVTFNAAGGVLIFVLCAYIAAIIPPCVRVVRAGQSITPLWSTFLGVALCGGYLLVGSGGLMPAVICSLFAGCVSARLIIYRQNGEEGHPTQPSDWLMFAPLVPAILFPNMLSPNIWAGMGALIATYLSFDLLFSNVLRVHRESGYTQAA